MGPFYSWGAAEGLRDLSGCVGLEGALGRFSAALSPDSPSGRHVGCGWQSRYPVRVPSLSRLLGTKHPLPPGLAEPRAALPLSFQSDQDWAWVWVGAGPASRWNQDCGVG